MRQGLLLCVLLCACAPAPPPLGVDLGSKGDAAAPIDAGDSAHAAPRRSCPEPSPIITHTSAPGDLVVATTPQTRVSELALPTRRAKEAALLLDDRASDVEVAGFVLSRATDLARLEDDVAAVRRRVIDAVHAEGGWALVRSAGSAVRSHERLKSQLGLVIDVILPARRASALREALVAALLSRPMASRGAETALGALPPAFGAPSTTFVVRLGVQRRVAFARDSAGRLLLDARGEPRDSGDRDAWRSIIAGAVSRAALYDDHRRQTGIVADDLTSLAPIARAATPVERGQCATFSLSLPAADFIWLVDGASLADHREALARHAAEHAARAASALASLRIGVVAVTGRDETPALCQGRFFDPSEVAAIRACVLAAARPPRRSAADVLDAVARALETLVPAEPTRWQRERGQVLDEPTKIRHRAHAQLIVATTRSALTSRLASAPPRCTGLESARYRLLRVDAALRRIVAARPTVLHLLGGTCSSRCVTRAARVTAELARRTGGQVLDICRGDLGPRLRIIVDSVIGWQPITSYRFSLPHRPIPASLAVNRDGVSLRRSRVDGFDFGMYANSFRFTLSRQERQRFYAAYLHWRASDDR